MKTMIKFSLSISIFLLSSHYVVCQTGLSNYEAFKQEERQKMGDEDRTTVAAQADYIISFVEERLDRIQKHPEDDVQKEVLYAYNFLRELLKKDPITSLQEIDHVWLGKLSYPLWKVYQEQVFKRDGANTRTSQINVLLCDTRNWLDYLEEAPENTYFQREALYRYNLLRELLDLPRVKRYREIDQTWFGQIAERFSKREIEKYVIDMEEYNGWKEAIQKQFEEEDIVTLAAKVNHLIFFTKMRLENAEYYYCDAFKKILYGYNVIRELLHLPLVMSFSAIDRNWLDQIEEEALRREFMEQNNCESPTAINLFLVKKAQELLKIRNEIEVFSSVDRKGLAILMPSGKPAILLSDNPDIDQQMNIIYHEFGHVVYELEDEMALEDEITLYEGKKTYEELLQDHPKFKAYVERAEEYIELGSKVFDKSTPVGKHIIDVLSRNPLLEFWTPPHDKKELNKSLYKRGIEKRADIFAVENLFEQQQLDVILSLIADGAFAIPVDSGDYPSDMERALCRAGFLVDKGIDINKAFQKWYAKGVCKAVPQNVLNSVIMQPVKSQGARDFQRAYEALEAKELIQRALQEKGYTTRTEQVIRLVEMTKMLLEYIEADPHGSFLHKVLVDVYNALRELLNESFISSWQKIDQEWLNEQYRKASAQLLLSRQTKYV